MSYTDQQLHKLDKVQLDASWKYGLSDFLLSSQMDELRDFLLSEKQAQKEI